MPPAGDTIRGTFDLNAESAIRQVRELKSEGAAADASLRAVGGALDKIGTQPQQQRLRNLSNNIRDLVGASSEAKAAVESATSSVQEFGRLDEKAHVGLTGNEEVRQVVSDLRDDLERFGRMRESAHVDISGVARARAELAGLEAQLTRFAHRHATATARVRTAGGGGLGSVPGSVARAAAGGGGAAAGGLRAPPGIVMAGLAGLPLIQALGGTALGLGGSAAAGAVGAGTVGGAGIATLGVGLAPTIGVAREFTKDMKQVTQAQIAYSKAVAEYGKASTEAATAHKRLDAAYSQNPGVRRATQNIHALTEAVDDQIGTPGRRAFTGMIATQARQARRALPRLAPGARRDIRATTRAGAAFTGTLLEPQGDPMRAIVAMQREFARDMPLIEHTLGNILVTASNIARASLPYFHEANVWIDHQTAGWAVWSQNTARVHRDIDHGVNSFRDWSRLAGSTFRFVRDLFSLGRPTGDSAVLALSHTFDRWDQWLRLNPGRARQFFHEAWDATKNIAGAVWQIARALGQVSNLLLPVLSRFAQLAQVAGGAGLLLPLGLRFGMASMLRNRDPAVATMLGGRRFGRGAGGGAIEVMGGGTRAGGGAVVGGPAMERSFLAPRGLGPGTGVPPGVDPRSLMLYGSGRRMIQIGGALPRGELATPEMFAQRFGGIEGARFAGPMSQAGARAYGLGRLAPLGGAALTGLRAAGRFVWPLAAIGGVLGAAQYGTGGQGAGGLLSNVVSGASFGLAPPVVAPRGDEVRTHAFNRARGYLMHGGEASFALGRAGFWPGAGANFLGIVDPIRALAQSGQPSLLRRTQTDPAFRQQALAQGQLSPVGLPGSPTGLRQALAGYRELSTYLGGLQRRVASVHGKDRDAIIGQIAAVKELRQTYGTYMTQQEAIIAQNFPRRLGKEFSYLTQHGHETPHQAITDVGRDLLGQMRKMGPQGAKQLGNNTLQWARQLEKANPQLKGIVDDLEKQIVQTYRRMGKTINIVNGQILDGSTAEWRSIGQSMTDPLEKAKERLQTSFTQIQQMAVGSLMSMGFSRSQARGIVTAMEKHGAGSVSATGRRGQAGRRADVAGPVGGVGRGTGPGSGPNGATGKRMGFHQAGGRLPGFGLGDIMRTSDGGYGAPGELLVNRHTEADVDRDLRHAGKPPLAARVVRETRPHSAPPDPAVLLDMAHRPSPYARGSRMGPQLGGSGGGLRSAVSLAGVHQGVLNAARAIEGRFPGLTITSGTGGSHVSGSYHYKGEAVDIAGSGPEMFRASDWIKSSGLYRKLAEGIHNPNLAVKDGRMVSPSFYSGVWAGHANHIHVAVAGALGALGALRGGGAAAGQLGQVHLHGITSGLQAVPGALADRGSAIYAAGLQRKINRHLAQMGGGADLSGFTGGGSAQANQQLGRRMMLAAGWPASEWPALRSLWNQESGWTPQTNPSSGAYGIPQALGHGHPFDIHDIPAQIRWGLNYIRGRYGSPSAAWAHERANNWYATGGRMPDWLGWFDRGTDFVTTPGRPVLFGAGERAGRRERVQIGPASSRGGRGGHTFNFDFRGATVSSQEHVEEVGRYVAGKIIEALDRGEVTDAALT